MRTVTRGSTTPYRASSSQIPKPDNNAWTLLSISASIGWVEVPDVPNVHYRLTFNKNLFMHSYVHLASCSRGRCVIFLFIRSKQLTL